MPLGGPNSERVLIFVVRQLDGEIASRLLTEVGFPAHTCRDAAALTREMRKGAGCAVIADEAIDAPAAAMLHSWVREQPAWSDLPVIVLTRHANAMARSRSAVELQDTLGNISLVERPFHPRMLASVTRAALRSRRRQYEARELLERYELLARELQHRTKNLMAVIQSIAAASLRDGTESQNSFIARLHALADAQDLLMEGDAHGAFLLDVARQITRSLAEKVAMNGPRVHLKPALAQGFALIVHELATNAVKHGALRSEGGNISIDWALAVGAAATTLTFNWREKGGPTVLPPKRTSFGTVLLERAVANAGDPPRFDYSPQGFAYELSVTLH